MSEEATSAPPRPTPSVRQLVLGAATLMIVAQLGFRAWALYPSWFYTDDYRLLSDARGSNLTLAYLLEPFDNQFMPFGRLVAWVVSGSGDVNWAMAATLTLAVQLLASAAALWMLITLFGSRPAILGLLGLYLSLAISAPALMWWAASLNQLPLQAVLFAAVAAWVRYLRSRRWRWLALSVLLVGFGMLAYVKAVLVVAVMAFLLLAYFTSGSPIHRVRSAVRGYWPAALAFGGLSIGFAIYYTAKVPSIFQAASWSLAGELADSMLGTALVTGLLGGPWRWDNGNPPVGLADPPAWAVHVSWCALVVMVIWLALRRERTGRAWLLLTGYVAAAFLLLLTSRAPVAGAAIGLELRYLTDIVSVAVLCLGLAFLPLVGARQSSAPRPAPRLDLEAGPRAQAGLFVLVCALGLTSTVAYVRTWHDDNPGDRYTHTLIEGLADQGPVDLADQPVPSVVIPGFSFPYNTTGMLVPLLVDDARFPTETSDLSVIAPDGEPRRALIAAVSTSEPGPVTDCGWRVRDAGRTIPLDQTAFDYTWWIRIGYLGSAEDEVTITAGDRTVTAPVQRGPNSLFLQVTSAVSSVTLDGLSPDTTLCVDTIEVGTAVPGGPL